MTVVKFPCLCRHLFDTEAVYFLETARIVHMDRMCNYRYLVYIESYGFSASLKYRLACASVLFQGAHCQRPRSLVLCSLPASSDAVVALRWKVAEDYTCGVCSPATRR